MDAERKAEIRTRCDPSQRQPCRAYLEDVPDLLAAIDELEDERDTATRYLGQALTCAIHGLDEMNWKDVEDWLRRDEPASPYYRPCETVRAATDD
jgi:hypothetical protein